MISVWSMSHFFSKTEPPILIKLLHKLDYALNEVFKKVSCDITHKQKKIIIKNFFSLVNVRICVPCPDVCPYIKCPDFCPISKCPDVCP